MRRFLVDALRQEVAFGELRAWEPIWRWVLAVLIVGGITTVRSPRTWFLGPTLAAAFLLLGIVEECAQRRDGRALMPKWRCRNGRFLQVGDRVRVPSGAEGEVKWVERTQDGGGGFLRNRVLVRTAYGTRYYHPWALDFLDRPPSRVLPRLNA